MITSIAAFGAIALAAGIILAVAYSKLKVEEDPTVEKITEVLPGLNCGACGYASCHEYARHIAEKESDFGLCRPGGEDTMQEIADILGVEGEGASRKVKAVVRCGVKDRIRSAVYEGSHESCLALNVTGAGMACRYGCLGGGDCVEVCPVRPVRAIKLNENNVPVIDYDKCTGCGLCVEACPRDIITLVEPRNEEIVYVGCMSLQSAKETKSNCSEGCIGCRLCERRAPEGMFLVEENLASVKKQTEKVDVPGIKCPADCIYVLKRKS
ncbi:MAG: RnfABCDGE type electron transport complex subunit B [Elusimicrobiota bacterium]|nr:RnfABCDGE type electron transport complex subunit B [Elusimicrobiota bacterium]